MIFRRDKTQPATTATDDALGGKGRPTPSRKQAEAERMERLKASSRGDKSSRGSRASRAADAASSRASRSETRKRIVAGDERVLAARDRGPERRMARDLVDSRHTVGEYFLYLAILVLVLGLIRVSAIAALSQVLLVTIVVALVIDSVRINRGVTRAVRERYPDGNTAGIGRYAMMRGMVTRRMRVPAPQVKRGSR